MKAALTAIMVLVAATGSARAASDAAWDAFRRDVAAACAAKAALLFEDVTARVDPFGSESYGLALLTGVPKGSSEPFSTVCVYDKRTKTVEIGSTPGLVGMERFLTAFTVPFPAAPPAGALDDTRDRFRRDVGSVCRDVAKDLFADVTAEVDPLGSPSYGLTLMKGTARSANVPIEAICVFDRAKRVVEMGGELPTE